MSAGVGVVFVGDNAAAMDGGDGEEEDAAIITSEANDTAVPQPPAINLHPPNDVGALVFPRDTACWAFQAGRGGRDQRNDLQGG